LPPGELERLDRPLLPGASYCLEKEVAMTDLLEKALTEVKKLPPEEQDALAAILMQELAAEQRWTESFAKSQDALEKLAQEALAEYRAGLTKPL
jgi:hypothetical protein